MKPAWFVREYKKGDEYGIARLMKLEYGGDEDYWRELWIWECVKSPMGHLTTVTEHNGQIVGKMSLVLVQMKMGSETFVGSQAVDLVVHPSFRRQGMFLTIGKHLLGQAENKGIPISYGFPNRPARAGHLKYGWFDVCNVPIFIKFLDTYNTIRRYVTDRYGIIKVLNKSVFPRLILNCFLHVVALGLNFGLMISRRGTGTGLEKAKITRVHRFDQRFDEFWKGVSNTNGIIVVRDSRYLNWRYFEKPYSDYVVLAAEKDNKIMGYIILRFEKVSGTIIDTMAYPNSGIVKLLLSEAADYFRRKKASWITCSMLPIGVYYRALKENRFVQVPSENPLIARVNTPGVSEAFVKDFRNWHSAAGDSVNRVA